MLYASIAACFAFSIASCFECFKEDLSVSTDWSSFFIFQKIFLGRVGFCTKGSQDANKGFLQLFIALIKFVHNLGFAALEISMARQNCFQTSTEHNRTTTEHNQTTTNPNRAQPKLKTKTTVFYTKRGLLFYFFKISQIQGLKQ